MTKDLSPTAEPITPTSAALKFVQKSSARPNNSGIADQEDSSLQGTTDVPKKRTRKSKQPPASMQTVKAVYQPFSTRLRSDLKRRLKRLSHDREDRDAEVKSVQQFVEEAILLWLDAQEDAA